MMSYWHNDNFVSQTLYDDIVWKAPEHEPLSSLPSRGVSHAGEGNNVLLKEVEGGVYCSGKFYAQTRTLSFIPSCSLSGLFGCFFEDSNSAHYRRASLSWSLRRNSARSMSLAVPASISPRRRKISLSHSSEASGSDASSRLLIRAYARSARSDSGSVVATILGR